MVLKIYLMIKLNEFIMNKENVVLKLYESIWSVIGDTPGPGVTLKSIKLIDFNALGSSFSRKD